MHTICANNVACTAANEGARFPAPTSKERIRKWQTETCPFCVLSFTSTRFVSIPNPFFSFLSNCWEAVLLASSYFPKSETWLTQFPLSLTRGVEGRVILPPVSRPKNTLYVSSFLFRSFFFCYFTLRTITCHFRSQ